MATLGSSRLGDRPRARGPAQGAGGSRDAGRSDVVAGVDDQVDQEPGRRADRAGPCGVGPHGGKDAACAGLSAAGQHQGHRRPTARGPRRPVPLPGSPSRPIRRGRSAGDLGRCEEEGAGRGVQERRPRVPADRAAGAGQRARLPGQGAGQGDPVRHLRRVGQHWLGERGDRPRHLRLRGGDVAQLVGRRRTSALPRREPAADLRRWRWLQRVPGAGLEDRARRVRLGHRSAGDGLPSTAWHLEVEQDRTPAVQPDHDELARPAAQDSPGHRGLDQQHHHRHRAHRALQPRHRRVPARNRLHRSRCRRATPATPRLPRGVELRSAPRTTRRHQVISSRVLRRFEQEAFTAETGPAETAAAPSPAQTAG